MKIAILGTKGIPNNYGGFEQFAEYLSVGLANLGHEVTVYNPDFHPFAGNEFKGVRIVKVFSPEKFIGAAANFIYDHLCLQHALKQDYDLIYEAGYHSVAFSYKLLGIKKRIRPVLLTNMDGLEWKRSKWSGFTRNLIKRLEKIAVDESPYLISDNEGIRKYYKTQFNRDSFFLPYGADHVEKVEERFLKERNLTPHSYFMVVARLEPENNIELVLEGYSQSPSVFPMIVVGNYKTKYGEYLKSKYNQPNVLFVGGIYDKKQLDSLRHFSIGYFHGHSVGGTNPSLLEAMACRCFIIAHDNEFNHGVLGDDALYVSSVDDIKEVVTNIEELRKINQVNFDRANFEKVNTIYNWDLIIKQHENLFDSLINRTPV